MMHILTTGAHRPYTVKARQSKDTSLDTKHLCIRLALAEARVMILFMWLLNFRLFSTVTPRSIIVFTVGTGLLLMW